jgi:hypothetical protein
MILVNRPLSSFAIIAVGMIVAVSALSIVPGVLKATDTTK